MTGRSQLLRETKNGRGNANIALRKVEDKEFLANSFPSPELIFESPKLRGRLCSLAILAIYGSFIGACRVQSAVPRAVDQLTPY